jgi:ParB family chromosome partitioning protein
LESSEATQRKETDANNEEIFLDNVKAAFPIHHKAFGDFIRQNRGSQIYFTAKKLSTFMRNNDYPPIKDGEDDRILGLILKRMEDPGAIELVDPNHNGGKLYRVIQAPKDVSQKGEQLTVPISSLREPAFKLRLSTPTIAHADLSGLMVTIREFGMIDPILVRRIGKETFEIIDGVRRYRACMSLGYVEYVPVRVIHVQDSLVPVCRLVANAQRLEPTDWDLAHAIHELIEVRGQLGITECARYLGCSEQKVKAYLSVFALPVERILQFKKGLIPISDILRLQAKGLDIQEIEELLAKKYDEKLPLEIVERAAEIKAKKKDKLETDDAVEQAKKELFPKQVGQLVEGQGRIVANKWTPTFRCPHGSEYVIDVKNVLVIERQTQITEFARIPS